MKWLRPKKNGKVPSKNCIYCILFVIIVLGFTGRTNEQHTEVNA